MKALISGGRTGGHLVPGIAVYKEIKKRNIECRYVMSAFDLNYPIVSKVDEKDRILLQLKNMSRRLSLKTPLFVIKILISFFKIFRLIKKFNPDMIVITGGYISNPVALAAIILRKPLYIIEQNSVAGITNRLYSPFARKIFTSFPGTKKIPAKKAVFTGNPSLYYELQTKTKSKSFFQIDQFATVIGITSGSQGSRIVNDCVQGIFPMLLEKKIGVIWSAGSVEYNKLLQENKLEDIQSKYPNIRVFQFIERMDYFFSAADCVISRAGATSISECIHYECPPILIPIKNSPDNHQLLNAGYIASNSGGIIIEEDSLTPDYLFKEVSLLLKNASSYKENMKKINSSRPQRAEKGIVDIIIADQFGLNL